VHRAFKVLLREPTGRKGQPEPRRRLALRDFASRTRASRQRETHHAQRPSASRTSRMLTSFLERFNAAHTSAAYSVPTRVSSAARSVLPVALPVQREHPEPRASASIA
jgi:hypothetical protein